MLRVFDIKTLQQVTQRLFPQKHNSARIKYADLMGSYHIICGIYTHRHLRGPRPQKGNVCAQFAQKHRCLEIGPTDKSISILAVRVQRLMRLHAIHQAHNPSSVSARAESETHVRAALLPVSDTLRMVPSFQKYTTHNLHAIGVLVRRVGRLVIS